MAGVVLVFGHPRDSCASAVAGELRQRGIRVEQIDASDLSNGTGLTWSMGGALAAGVLSVGPEEVPLEDVAGVLARDTMPSALPAGMSVSDGDYVATELNAALTAVLNALECPVLNRPLLSSGFGAFQSTADALAALERNQLSAPPTLFTTRTEPLRRFLERFEGGLYHSGTDLELSQQLVDSRDPATLPHPGPGVACLQAIVGPGQWLDVFVVADAVIGAGPPDGSAPVASPARLGTRVVPSSVATRARRLAADLGLEFARLRLMLPTRGRDRCYEVSSCPRFDDCDEAVQTQVIGALASRLTATVGAVA